MMTSRTAPRQGHWGQHILVVFGLICILVVVADLWANVQAGGDPWKQADWLINEINQPVRRGALGSVFVWIADHLGVSPLVPVYLAQLGCLAVLSASLLLVLHRAEPKAALAILVFSPAFIFVFWAADPAGSLRKELIGYTAISLLLLVPLYPGGARILTAVSVLLFAVACIGHEINVLLVPAYAIVFLLCLNPGMPALVIFAIYLLVLCAGTMFYSVTHTTVADHTGICTPLTARGIDPQFCIGAIVWMERGADFGKKQVGMMFLSLYSLGRFGLSYGVVAAPFLYLVSRMDRPGLVLGAALLLMVPVLPLYPVAVDWGRWMNLHVMSFAFVFLAALQVDVIRVVRPVNKWVLGLVVLTGLLWEQPHAGLPRPGGLVADLVTAQAVQ